MRLAFTGASGTGKTTLAQWVSKTWDLPINPVGSRSIAKAMGFDNPYDVDKAGKRAEFQRRLVTEKKAWEEDHESFVVDRTTFDNLVYTIMHDVHAVDRELLDDVVQGLERYTHIVFCPVEVFCKLGDDPNRVKDHVYHKLFDECLRALTWKYTSHTVHMITLQKVGLENRKKYLRGLLNGV